MAKNKQSPSSFKGSPESRDVPGMTPLHVENLHDEDTTPSGESYNLATGIAFDNSDSRQLEADMAALHEIDNFMQGDEDDSEVERLLSDRKLAKLMKDPEMVELFESFDRTLLQADIDDFYQRRRSKQLAKTAFK